MGGETDDEGNAGVGDVQLRLVFFFKGRSNNNDALVLTTLKKRGHNSLEKYAEKAHIWLLNSKKIPTQK